MNKINPTTTHRINTLNSTQQLIGLVEKAIRANDPEEMGYISIEALAAIFTELKLISILVTGFKADTRRHRPHASILQHVF
jgi:hypothetical protein